MLHTRQRAFVRLVCLAMVTSSTGGCTLLENPPLFWDASVTESTGGQGGDDSDSPDADDLGGKGGEGGDNGGSGAGGEFVTGGNGGSTVVPTGGSGGATNPRPPRDGSMGSPDTGPIPTGPAAACTFQFSVTTVTMRGDYRPD